MYKIDIRPGGEGGFYGKGFVVAEQLLYALQHQFASLYGHAVGVEWREAAGYFIGIDELMAVKNLGQYGVGSCRLASSVATCYYVEILCQFVNLLIC